jgi:hypothetical protein
MIIIEACPRGMSNNTKRKEPMVFPQYLFGLLMTVSI